MRALGSQRRRRPVACTIAVAVAAIPALGLLRRHADAAPFSEHFGGIATVVTERLAELGDGATRNERRRVRALRAVQADLARPPVDIRRDVHVAARIAARIGGSAAADPDLGWALDELTRDLLVEARMRHVAVRDEALSLAPTRRRAAALRIVGSALRRLERAGAAETDRAALDLARRAGDRLLRAERAIAAVGRPTVAESLERPVAAILHPDVPESSGLVVLDGAYWTHNDSGGAAVLYRAADPSFADAEVLPLPGADAVDWEDLTVLDGDLVVCDCGDNSRVRDDLVLYRARYVPADPAAGTTSRLDLVAAYPFAYPDGRHDAEAATVIDGKVHLVIKNRGEPDTGVYRFDSLTAAADLPPGQRNVPAKIAALSLLAGEQVTGATIHRGRSPVVLLSYLRVLVYDEDEFAGAPRSAVPLPIGVTLQCEGVAFAGDRLVITNEQRDVFAVPDFLTRE